MLYIWIPEGCFWHCQGLKNVNGLDSVEKVEEEAFAYCGSLESFDWPVNCKEIPDKCFDSCHSLKELNIKGDITRIGEHVVSYTSLKELDLSNSFCCNISPSFQYRNGIENDIKVILPFYQEE